MFYGKKPEGAKFYARRGKFEFIVWDDPQPGDAMSTAATGRTESQLVRDILDGKFNFLFACEGVCPTA